MTPSRASGSQPIFSSWITLFALLLTRASASAVSPVLALVASKSGDMPASARIMSRSTLLTASIRGVS